MSALINGISPRSLLVLVLAISSNCVVFGLHLSSQGIPAGSSQDLSSANAEKELRETKAYLQAGRTIAALQLVRKISAANPQDVQLHFTLAMLLTEANQLRAAQHELETAQAWRQQAFEILSSLGKTYFLNREYSKADLVLKPALNLRSDS